MSQQTMPQQKSPPYTGLPNITLRLPPCKWRIICICIYIYIYICIYIYNGSCEYHLSAQLNVICVAGIKNKKRLLSNVLVNLANGQAVRAVLQKLFCHFANCIHCQGEKIFSSFIDHNISFYTMQIQNIKHHVPSDVRLQGSKDI